MANEMTEMEELVEKLNQYAYEYYVLDAPTVSDATFDALYDRLVSLERSSGTVLPDSPTRRVGGTPLGGFVPHTHKNRLYSLDKCTTTSALAEWDEKVKKAAGGDVTYSLEYKLDGLTLCLTYDGGRLVTAATRGDGVMGEDVTNQVLTIKSVPLKIDFDGVLEVQGEGIMKKSAFERYNKSAAEPLKNPRNGVAGAIRNLDPKETAKRQLDIFFYNINYIEGGRNSDKNGKNNEESITSQRQIEQFLSANRFATYPAFYSSSMDEIIAKIGEINRESLDFAIDGMVIKVNDFLLREQLGYTDKFPRWAKAFKFEAEEADTVLDDVVWNVGRTGKLTPLAILQPVELGGATVRRATLNNYGDIVRKKVKKGSTVFIRRSGDVIPEILGAVEGSGGTEIEKPTICPACGSALFEEGAHIFCPSITCPPQICGRLEHFAAKDCMDIEGLSTQTIRAMNEVLGVTRPTQIYALTAADFARLDGYKDKKIANVLEGIEKSKNASLPRFICALGIPNVGKKLSKDLAARYKSIDSLMAADKEELAAIPDIGEVTAVDICRFFEQNKPLIAEFKAAKIDPVFGDNVGANAGSGQKDKIFSGKNFVLTGTLPSLTRGQASEMIENNGGTVQSSVSKTTDFVLAGESAGSKLEKAREKGIKIIDENEFLALLNT